MRLCYISNPDSIHTRRWVNWFFKRGHAILLIADSPHKQPWPGVEIVDLSSRINKPRVRFIPWVLWTRQIINSWHPDILHAHQVSSAGWLGAMSGFHPFVVTPWGSDIYRRAKHSRIARLLTIFTLRRADLITTNSYAISQQVLSLGARPRTTNFIQFGVELDIFSPSTNDLDFTSLHQRLELPSNSRLVLSARGVNTVYNLDIILNAIPDVIQRFPEAIFLFIDYNTNPSYKQQLESQILGMNLSPHIRWLPQTNSRTEMAEIYRQSDVVVSVPTTDGTPISVLEALACEKPVVCTDLPSLREFITSGENGLLVPVRQPGPLADAIIQLLAHPEIALTLGKFGRQVVAQKANVETEMQRMESLYRQLTDLKLGKTGC